MTVLRVVFLHLSVCQLSFGLRLRGEGNGVIGHLGESRGSELLVARQAFQHLVDDRSELKVLWDGRVAMQHSPVLASSGAATTGGSSATTLLNSRDAGSLNPQKLAVCIVGQLSRLETASKIRNVLQVAAKTRSVDVFVVLETSSNHFVNPDTASSSSPVCRTDFLSPAGVRKAFSPFYRDGLYVKHESYRPNLRNWLMYGLDGKPLDRATRLGSHIQQWTHTSACATLIEQHENATGVVYDAVVKLRDNTVAVKPFNVPATPALTHVLAKECSSYGGVSDKVMIVPRQYLSAALHGPIENARAIEMGNGYMISMYAAVTNPEIMLNTTLTLRHCPLRQDDNAFPLVDGRCLGEGSQNHRMWCLVQPWKDCHPEQYDKAGFPTCPDGGKLAWWWAADRKSVV